MGQTRCLKGAPLFCPPEPLLQFHVEKVAHTVPWALAEWIQCRASSVQIGSLHMLVILTEGSSKVPPLCELLFNPVGSRETVWPSPGRYAWRGWRGRTSDPKCFHLFLRWLFRKARGEQKEAKPPLKLGVPVSLSTPTQTTSRRQGDPCDPAWSLDELPNERTTSGNFLLVATLPASRPSPPPGWVLRGRRSHRSHRGSRRPAPGTGCERSRVAGAGARCLLEGAQGSGGAVSITVRFSLEPKFSSLLTLQKASSGAESPFSAPRSSRPIQ